MSIKEIIYNTRDAVVGISGQVGLTSDSFIQRGTGFFIKNYYIICPASVILISPDVLTSRQRIPDIETDHPWGRVSRILASVSNVNGSGKAYSYQCSIVGVDPAVNIAVLRIDSTCTWNHSTPAITSDHPYLHWGKSRSAAPGDRIIVIGDIMGADVIGHTDSIVITGAENGVVIGNLADNRYVSYTGSVPGELLLLSNILSRNLQQGLPIINLHGKVIGMTICTDETLTNNLGISEFFMRRPVKSFIRQMNETVLPDTYVGFVHLVPDPLGDYYRFNKSYLGLAGVLMTQDHFLQVEVEGSKEICGYVITKIMEPNTVDAIIQVGDIITHVNKCPLGDRKGQVSPSLVMWRVKPGSTVEIQYKRLTEQYSQTHLVELTTDSYPLLYDFPWYAVSVSTELKSMPAVLI